MACCFPARGPQPSMGVTENAHCAEGTVDLRSPLAPASSATKLPALASCHTCAMTSCGSHLRISLYCIYTFKGAAKLSLTLMPGLACLIPLVHTSVEGILDIHSDSGTPSIKKA